MASNYADVLESYIIYDIAEEGFGEAIKKAGKFVGKVLLSIIQAIKRVLQGMVNKLRQLASRKNGNKKESKNDLIERLDMENREKANKIQMLERALKNQKDTTIMWEEAYKERSDRAAKDGERNLKELRQRNEELYSANKENDSLKKDNSKLSEKKEKATKLIADLKKEIAANKEKIESIKKNANTESTYAKFRKTCLTFISHVTQQINKAYTVLPKLVAEAKKFDGADRKSLHESKDGSYEDTFIDKRDSDLPTMASGNWSYLYKSLKFSYLPKVKENGGYLEWNYDIGRGFEILVKQATQTIEYLEKMVRDMNNGAENNPAYKNIIQNITKDNGFIEMLRSSINLSNEILTCFVTHDKMIIHTIHDAI